MRIGLLDIGAVGVVVALLILPTPPRHLEAAYFGQPPALVQAIAEAQAEVVRRPEDARAVERLSELLVFVGETDWAMRTAGLGIQRLGASEWRAYAAVSQVHVERVELPAACTYAEEALRRCTAHPEICSPLELTRLETLAAALRAGVDSGIDPRINFDSFDDAVRRQVPVVTTKPRPIAPQ